MYIRRKDNLLANKLVIFNISILKYVVFFFLQSMTGQMKGGLKDMEPETSSEEEEEEEQPAKKNNQKRQVFFFVVVVVVVVYMLFWNSLFLKLRLLWLGKQD